MRSPLSSGTNPPGVDRFLRLILRSGLLTRPQLLAALRGLPSHQRRQPEAVADYLVRQGHLSRFQARKLLRGNCRGLVLGPFQVLAPIARGGMGTVYLARDERSQQLVALKILPPERANKEQRMLARFQREMEMSRLVSHPHLAWTLETGLHHGVYYIAMEFLPGRSLHRMIADQGPLPLPRAARLLAEVALGLEHAHQQGLVHRDVKPANIIISPQDHAKLLDLGLALVQGEKGGDREVVGGQGYVVGTMDYISPEQIEDPLQVDRRADIYSLGCTLYHTLTGQPPFPGGTNREKMHRHRTEEPIPLTQRLPNIPRSFAALVEWMMAKSPQNRLGSAAQVIEHLQPWQDRPLLHVRDQEDDRAFARAVADLELAEPAEEQLVEPILDGDPEVIYPSATDSADCWPAASPADRWARWWLPVLLGLAAFLGLIVWLS